MTSLNILFVLSALIFNNHSQLINCGENDTCDCPDESPTPGAICILNCHTIGICKDQTLNCREGDPCQIICNEQQSCENTTINAPTATHLSLICSSEQSCMNNININCGKGDCILQCDSNNSCLNWGYIDYSHSSSFRCRGYCENIPNNTLLIAETSIINNTKTLSTNSNRYLISFISLDINTIIFMLFVTTLIVICLCAICLCYARTRMNKQTNHTDDKHINIQSKSTVSHMSQMSDPMSPMSPLSAKSTELSPSVVTIIKLNADCQSNFTENTGTSTDEYQSIPSVQKQNELPKKLSNINEEESESISTSFTDDTRVTFTDKSVSELTEIPNVKNKNKNKKRRNATNLDADLLDDLDSDETIGEMSNSEQSDSIHSNVYYNKSNKEENKSQISEKCTVDVTSNFSYSVYE